MPSVVPMILRRMRTVGFTLIPGVDDQGNPWRMSFFEAFYVVSYTGSTIGFGEVPYDFSGGQRMWTMVSIYLTVFSWLYSVGIIISLLQDKSFRQELSRVQLQRSLRRFREPFYVICGYGDTGKLLTRSLLSRGMRVVIVDKDPEAIDSLRVKDQGLYVPGFTVDAEIPGNLVKAGLKHPLCRGVLAVTDNNHTNLKIATTVKLLNKHIVVGYSPAGYASGLRLAYLFARCRLAGAPHAAPGALDIVWLRSFRTCRLRSAQQGGRYRTGGGYPASEATGCTRGECGRQGHRGGDLA